MRQMRVKVEEVEEESVFKLAGRQMFLVARNSAEYRFKADQTGGPPPQSQTGF